MVGDIRKVLTEEVATPVSPYRRACRGQICYLLLALENQIIVNLAAFFAGRPGVLLGTILFDRYVGGFNKSRN